MFRRILSIAVLVAAPLTAFAQLRIIQTNAGSGNIHVIDPQTNAVVGEIKGIPVNHGAAAAPDGTRLYFSSEQDRTLDVVNPKTLAVTKKIALSGRPNNIFSSKDGRRVYVAIVSEPGAVDVIDTASLERVKTITTKGGVHNVYVTPDGKYILACSIAGKNITVVDAATDQVAWDISFNAGVRPVAIEANADGSTRRLFAQLTDFNGFAIVDFKERKELERVALPEIAAEKRDMGPYAGAPSHGIGVAPDGKSLWVASRRNAAVYQYSLPDLKLVGSVDVGKRPDWITFTPDSKRLYVASEGTNTVSAIDIASRKELARIPVGESPKRNITAVLR